MPLHAGFLFPKQEYDYNKALQRIFHLVIDQLTLQL